MAGSSKRGNKSKKEVMENNFEVYTTSNPAQVRILILRWERDCGHKEDEIENQENEMEFIMIVWNSLTIMGIEEDTCPFFTSLSTLTGHLNVS